MYQAMIYDNDVFKIQTTLPDPGQGYSIPQSRAAPGLLVHIMSICLHMHPTGLGLYVLFIFTGVIDIQSSISTVLEDKVWH